MPFSAKHYLRYWSPDHGPVLPEQSFRFSPSDSDAPVSVLIDLPYEYFRSNAYFPKGEAYFSWNYHFVDLKEIPDYLLDWYINIDTVGNTLQAWSAYTTPTQYQAIGTVIQMAYRGYFKYDWSGMVVHQNYEDVEVWTPFLSQQDVDWFNYGNEELDEWFSIHVRMYPYSAFPRRVYSLPILPTLPPLKSVAFSNTR